MTLNKKGNEVTEDLKVWQQFLADYNGKSFFLSNEIFANTSLKLFTDSCTSIGYGGYFCSEVFSEYQWFAGEWTDWWKSQNIMILELYPIVIAIELWAYVLENKRLLIFTDNYALVSVINKKTSKNALAMILVRRLVLACLKHNVFVLAQHITGVYNRLADALSRQEIAVFLKDCPNAAKNPIALPPLPLRLI